MTRRPALGYALVVIGALLLVLNAGVSRVLLRSGVDAGALTTARMTGTVLVVVVFCAVLRPDALRPPPRRLRWLLLLHGLVGVAGVQWTYFIAIERLPVGMALLLEYLAPLFVALWARFIQSRALTPRAWVGLGVALVGLALATGVAQGELRFDGVGVLAGLGAAVCFATYFLVGEHGVAELDPLRVILWSFGIGALAMNLIRPLLGFPTAVLGDDLSLLGRLEMLQAPGAVLLAWVVVPGTLLPFALFLASMSHLSAATVTTVAMIEPVGVVILGWLWFDESLGAVAVVGCALVLGGVVATQTGVKTRSEPAPFVGT